MERTDEQLARAAMRGDSHAFGVLVQRLRAPVIGHVVGLLGTREDAEELAQEAFLVGWQKLRSLREPARVAGWIRQIARNLAIRRAKALRTVPLAEEPAVEDDADPPDQRLTSLLAAVGRLSETHRDVITRKHFAGCSGEEIARQLGVAPGTVRSRLSRAYAELRSLVEREQAGD